MTSYVMAAENLCEKLQQITIAIQRTWKKQVDFDRPGERSPEQDCCC